MAFGDDGVSFDSCMYVVNLWFEGFKYEGGDQSFAPFSSRSLTIS